LGITTVGNGKECRNGAGMNIEQRRDRAVAWLNEIYTDVQDLIIDDHIFWEVQRIIGRNPRIADLPSHYRHWMMAAHVESAVIGVRRQVKLDQDSISLHRFLDEMAKYPQIVSRLQYVEICSEAPQIPIELHHRSFDRIVGAGAAHLDAGMPATEIHDMRALAANVEHLADRRFAHYDRRGLANPRPTFQELSNCLAFLEKVVLKYTLLLKGVCTAHLLPTFQYDWTEIFQYPWIEAVREGR
jgi:hypothetical protein